ncbi:MAG: threonine aldolase family protein [Micromonosporaceae bacterium]
MATSHDFASDNHAGAHPAVLRAIADAGSGQALAYGEDPWTRRLEEQFGALFGSQARAFLVFNGTAANILGVSLLLRRYEGVICAESAHLNVDECGAAERLIGCKLLTVDAPDGKLTPDLVAQRLGGREDVHRVQPRVVTISQVTELGTCYSLEELRKLGEFCRSSGLYLYVDGARLANAAAHLGCRLGALTEHADVISFGGTKNGATGVEAVIVMRPELCADAPYLRKQQLQLGSKMRFLSAQFLALLDGGLWLRSAQHANAMAQRLAGALAGIPGVEIRQPVESNAVFAALDPHRIERLQQEWEFYVWDHRDHTVRWMTSFDTSEADVDAFAEAIRAVCG